MAPGTQPSFRSVLPHEPLPKESVGYLHCQGSFEPRITKSKKHGGADQQSVDDGQCFEWTQNTLTKALLSSPWIQRVGGEVIKLELLETKPPFTKLRLHFINPESAFQTWRTWRRHKLTPNDLLSDCDLSSVFNGHRSLLRFSLRQIQVTLLTQTPMLSNTIAWTRSNPPKFRRLLHTDGVSLEEERRQARFVFITGLIDPSGKPPPPPLWTDPLHVADAVRRTVSRFDSSGRGVEIFVPHKTTAYHCHVGMRSPQDAQKLIKELQGQIVQWHIRNTDGQTETFESSKLFLDYADITQKSQARGRRTHGEEVVKGEPSRSECTSSTEGVVVPGLVLIENYVTEDEEKALMAVLLGPHAPWAPSQANKSLTGSVRRRVQHYGYVFDYETADVLRDRSVEKAACPPMPQTERDGVVLEEYIERCVREGRGWDVLAGIIERTRNHDFTDTEAYRIEGQQQVRYDKLNQLTVNEYKQGEGIGSHVDTPHAFGDGLISISLNSGIVMEFNHTESEQKKLVYLPARSLLLMSGDARYKWEHQIVTRMTDTHNGQVKKRGLRASLTLRTALQLPQDGGKELELIESDSFPPVWQSVGNDQTKNKLTTALTTPSTERDHVHAVYDAIATQWHHTRGKRGVLWPGATLFLQQLPRGSIVADVGCGDGKYFPAIWEAGSYVIGTDISRPLLKTSIGASASYTPPDSRRVSEHRHHLRDRPAIAVADCMNVPLRSNSCDAAICIAVMHHLSTESRRLRCIEELARIVKIGGLVNIQAWAMDQEAHSKRKFAATDVFVPFNAQPRYLDSNSQDKEVPDNHSVAQMFDETHSGAEFDERKGLVVFQRYCHLYRKGELEELSTRIPGIEIVQSGFESGNYFVILRVIS